MTFRPEDMRPLPEALLQAVLHRWDARVAAGDAPGPTGPKARAAIAEELRRLMAGACVAFEDDVPRAVFHDGRVMVLRGDGTCQQDRRTR